MKVLKKLLRPRVIIWAAVSVLLIATIFVANNLTNNYGPTIDKVLGGKTAIIDKETKKSFGEEYETKAEAREHGDDVVKAICEEGMVLLKNKDDAVLPLQPASAGQKIKVSVFGKNSVNLVYGGSGSAAPKDAVTKSIFDSLTAADIEFNTTLKSFYESSASGSGRSANPSMAGGAAGAKTLKTGETPIASYTDAVKNSYDGYKDAALVVFSRIAGENWDLPRFADANSDSTGARHYLELDDNERDLLRHIHASGFEHIVLLMNGSNYIDLGFLEERTNATDYNDFGQYVDAAIVIGSPGANGIMALGEILNGTVNPSGHTVDTVYTKYDEDPTWQNFGGYTIRFKEDEVTHEMKKVYFEDGDLYLKPNGSDSPYHFVDYEENIYQGYRYYETRGKDDDDWYNSHVLYPFGHGLSYTTFSAEIVPSADLTAALNPAETFDVQVKVKNTGSKAGKQVIQLYAEAPYYNGEIEKPHKVLAGFAKTSLLAPDAEEPLTITVNPYDFASFDNHDANHNGKKTWELDEGDYTFHVATDAHHDIASGTFVKNLAADYIWENDPVTGNKVEPLFDDVTNHMKESLSRTDFEGTFPHTADDNDRLLTSEELAALRSTESINSNLEPVPDEVPTMNAGISVPIEELIGKAYDDPLWDDFLDQMTFDEMLALFNNGCYSTIDIQRLGIPKTTSVDGPTGIVSFLGNVTDIGTNPVYGCCYYCSECLVAQTYNLELAKQEGFAVGNEAVVGDEAGEGLAYPGWYAPAVNIHRSPFSGRNTEYYSEDAFLNGKFATEVILAVQQRGVYVNIKHYALNDQETHRDARGIATWCDEQAMRENYLRAFEIAVKEGDPHGLMTSFNRIGAEWAGGSYRLCTQILRKEWGFVGSIICDYKTNDYMDGKQMLEAGGDIALCSIKDIYLSTSGQYNTVSKTNARDVSMLRRSAHNNLYAIVNSAAMRYVIKGYKPAAWRVILTSAEWGIVGLLAVWGFFMIFTALRAKPKAKKAKEGAVEEAPVEDAPVEEKQTE